MSVPNKSRGEFRPIYEAMVDHPKFQAISSDARLLLFVLKTTLGALGIRAVYTAVLCEQTGLPDDRVETAAKELEKGGWLRREWRIWWLVDGLEHEPHISLKNDKHESFVRKELATLPNMDIVRAFKERYGLRDTPTDSPTDSPSEAYTEPTPSTTPSTTTTPTESSEPNCGNVENSPDEQKSPLSRLPAHALQVLSDMKHPNNKKATARTLEASYLDRDDQSPMLEKAVHGLTWEKRVELVGRALVEFGAETNEWNARHFASFVRRLRKAPKPGTEAAAVHARGEPTGVYMPPKAYKEDDVAEPTRIDARALLESFGVSAPRGQA